MARTAIQCLVGLACVRGVELVESNLAHAYGLDGTEPSTTLLLRIAQENGLRARVVRLDWGAIQELGDALPALLRLKNGNWVALAGFEGGPEGPRAKVYDPLAEAPIALLLDQDTLSNAWSGDVLLAAAAAATDPDGARRFGLRWFLPELVRQRRLFTDVIAAAVVLYGLGLTVPIFSQLVIDKVLVNETYATLYVLAIGVVVALLFEALFTFLRRYLLLYASNRIDIRVSLKTFRHLSSLPLSYFERMSAGVLIKHMQQSGRVREFLTGRLLGSLLDGLSLVVFVPVLAIYSVKLTLIVLAFTGAVVLTVAILTVPFRRRLRDLYRAEATRQSSLVETIHGMRTIKSLAMEAQRGRDWDETSARVVAMRYHVDRLSAVAQSVIGLLEKMMSVAIIGLGAFDVFDRQMTVGALVAFNMLSSRVSGPLVQIVGMITEYQEVALSVRMLGEVMDAVPETKSGRAGLCPELSGEIEFDDVSFGYGAEAAPALQGVSFTIPAGSVIGVVGRSGSGKTTVTRLIQRLYPVTSGIIRMDGHDLREIDTVHLRTRVGVVLQDSFLFRGTIRDNIAAARPSASFEEIAQAAHSAGATEFIERMPRGYDTVLEESAENLSGGQRQRLSIARALLANPRLLILDEATSALDPESENIIRRNLRKIAEGRTVIIVSHRLSALVDTDATLVLDRGRIAAFAPHRELLGSCATYRHLWNQQTRHAA